MGVGWVGGCRGEVHEEHKVIVFLDHCLLLHPRVCQVHTDVVFTTLPAAAALRLDQPVLVCVLARTHSEDASKVVCVQTCVGCRVMGR